MTESKIGTSYAHCTVCCTDFSVASGGINKMKRHVDCKKHKELATEIVGQSIVSLSITLSSTTDQVSVGVATWVYVCY